MTQLGLLEGTGEIRKDAEISSDGLYRYRLTRLWDSGSRLVNWVMLNPSTADAHEDDPTIRRCIGFTKAWGYDGIVVTNLFALRTPHPRELFKAHDPVGPKNFSAVMKAAEVASLVVAAWGNYPRARERAHVVLAALRGAGHVVHCIAMTSSRSPTHPLYQPGGLSPVPYLPEAAK